mgnify:CR=1 FL=1
MIYIGTDLVAISRIKNLISRKGDKFINKIFSFKEQAICNNKYNSHIHFSGKFAAKEAVKKALLNYNKQSSIFVSLKDIQIINSFDGSPYVEIDYNLLNINKKQISITISHDKEYAISTALIF